MRRACRDFVLLGLGAMIQAACGPATTGPTAGAADAAPTDAGPGPGPSDGPAGPTDAGPGPTAIDGSAASPEAAPASPIGHDANGCLALVDHYATTPLPLRGKLVVTYSEPSIEDSLCEWDDASQQYWCPSPTATAPDCEEVDGTYWCPTTSPPAGQTGDPQELALFDLANPQAGVQRWTNNLVHEAELDISPDGSKVVYNVRRRLDAWDPQDGLGIWLIGSDGTNPTQLTPAGVFAGIPTWVPPGNTQFTFIRDDGFFLFDIPTLTTTPIVPAFPGYPSDPESSYDGAQITFKSDLLRASAPDIYVMQFNGSNVRRLTTGYSDHDPVFSRDNQKIYFERYYGPGSWDSYAELDRAEHPEINQWGIVEVDVATAEERVIIPHDPCGKHFVWLPTVSPDGQYLMFIHDYVDATSGYQDFWVADRTGANAQAVPNTAGFYWFDWGS
jgi:Tol biopolymer transport system component